MFVSTINLEGVVVAIGVGGSELYDGEGALLTSEGMTGCVFVSNAFVSNVGCSWFWAFFSVVEIFVVEGEIKESV